jgi:hypothetical protein
MDKKIKILEHIAEHGDCFSRSGPSWIECIDCPFAKLKRRPGGGGWLSCFEAVCGSDSISPEVSATKYKLIAEDLLASEILEQKLRDHDEEE